MKPLSALLALLLLFSCAMASSPVRLTVTVSSVLVSNDHVGNDWTISHTLNGIEYFAEDLMDMFAGSAPITLAAGDVLTIVTTVTEYDKDYPDSETVATDRTVTAEDLIAGFTVEVPVTVTETGGRYSGNTASWLITYTFTK